jgi:hypothetical protein
MKINTKQMKALAAYINDNTAVSTIVDIETDGLTDRGRPDRLKFTYRGKDHIIDRSGEIRRKDWVTVNE